VFDPLALTRGVHFAATLVASGTVGFSVLVADPPSAGYAKLRRQLATLTWLAITAVVISGAMWLVLLTADLLETTPTDILLNGGAGEVLADTRFGQVWCARLLIALALGLFVSLWPSLRWWQLGAAIALLAPLATVGHAGATPGRTGDVHLASDIVHLLAAGAWVGSLPALAFTLWQASRQANNGSKMFVVQAVRRFSFFAVFSVGALLASGIINTWNLVHSPQALVSTDYGRLLTIKIGLFVAMTAIAAVNKFFLTPRLPTAATIRALTWSSVAEIVLGLGVLLLVGVLGAMPPATHAHDAPLGIPPDAAFVHIHAAEAMADVTVEPGRAGRTDIKIRVSREDLSPYAAKDVHLALDPPGGSGQTIERNAVEQPDGTWWVNDVTIASPGIWTVRVLVQPSQGDAVLLDAPIVIEP